MFLMTFNLKQHSDEKLYMQIYHYIRSEIEAGNLAKGERLPSTRQLATHLQVSRNTVDTAYNQLLDEGYIESEPKRGFFISDIQALTQLNRTSPYQHPGNRYTENHHTENDPAKPSAATMMTSDSNKTVFSPYGVDLEHFPFDTWRKIAKNIFYDDRNTTLFSTGHPQGDFEFRSAITTYLHQSRGVCCTPEQIIIGAGIDYLLILLSQILPANTIYAVEDPSYLRSWQVLNATGAHTKAIPMDKNGIDIQALNASQATITCVTPSHHFPLGIVMPIKRRTELLSWAAQDEARYIIEDDYDSEFRYKGRPVPCLQGLGNHDKVIYLGTFSKAIAPSIRIAYMVLPTFLLKQYQQKLSFYTNTVARTEQRQLTDFINEGYFERHLNRMRTIYKAKRDYILKAFEPFQDNVSVFGENSGLHILLTFKDGRTSKDILTLTSKQGLQLFDLKEFYIEKHHNHLENTVILGYGALSLNVLKQAIPKLIDVLFHA